MRGRENVFNSQVSEEEPGPSGEPEKEPTESSSSTDTTDKASTPSAQDTAEQKGSFQVLLF